MIKSLIFFLALMIVAPLKAPSAGVIVNDQLGRPVTVPESPRRIIAFAPNITEIIFALGEEERLVGATRFSDFPKEAADLPKVGSYIHLDLEKIVSLKPDLCIAIKDGNPKTVIDRLAAFDIPVYAVDPLNLATVMETLLEISRLLGAQDKAAQLVENMRQRIEKVTTLVSQTSLRPRVFFQIGISPIVSVGSRTFIHELIVLAGGSNLAAGDQDYPRFSKEQVIGLSPDVFIITSMARSAVFERVRDDWSQWTEMPAIRNDRLFIQKSNLFDRPSPRLVEGLELMVKMIHPELFEDSK